MSKPCKTMAVLHDSFVFRCVRFTEMPRMEARAIEMDCVISDAVDCAVYLTRNTSAPEVHRSLSK